MLRRDLALGRAKAAAAQRNAFRSLVVGLRTLSVLFFRRPTKAERWPGTKQVWIAETRNSEDIDGIAQRFANRAEDDIARTLTIDQIKRSQGVLRPGNHPFVFPTPSCSSIWATIRRRR